jgi:negative regulator of replication initiation
MVQSELKQEIHYPEIRTLDIADQSQEVEPFLIELEGKNYLVALGKEKYDYSNKYRVVYFPLYLLSPDATKVKARIGIIESKTEDLVTVYDDLDQPDPNRMRDPLWFEFVTPSFLAKSKAQVESPIAPEHLSESKQEPAQTQLQTNPQEEKEPQPKTRREQEEEDAQELQHPTAEKQATSQKAKEIAQAHLKQGVFVVDLDVQPPMALPEESKEDVQQIKREFRKTAASNWLEKYFKNNQFQIVDNEGGGDCFFAVIRDAFQQIGKKTTIAKLRALLATEATADIYENYRSLYFQFSGEAEANERKLKEYGQSLLQLKAQTKKVQDMKEHQRLVEEGKLLVKEAEQVKQNIRLTRELAKEVAFMKGVDSMDKFRQVLQTPVYWADAWAIATLERVLNIKVLILSEEAYRQKELDAILLCGEAPKAEIAPFSPQHYILTTYSGSHYRLITYRHKNIFQFEEIPYSIKVLVVNKCLERNAGAYYAIPAFRHFKTQLGIDADEGAPISMEAKVGRIPEDDEFSSIAEQQVVEYEKQALSLEPEIVFLYHVHSDSSKKPGKGAGEQIPSNRRTDFTRLASLENWRRKLDDTWMGISLSSESSITPPASKTETQVGVFHTSDHLKWASVEHYWHAAKFRKNNPEFYAKFALSGEFGKSLELARQAAEPFGKGEKIASKEGKEDLAEEEAQLMKEYGIKKSSKKTKQTGGAPYQRPANIKIDPDFFGGRHREERTLALRAKFTQNMDLGVLLRETQKSVLMQFRRGEEPYVDFPLMRVREELAKSISFQT